MVMTIMAMVINYDGDNPSCSDEDGEGGDDSDEGGSILEYSNSSLA